MEDHNDAIVKIFEDISDSLKNMYEYEVINIARKLVTSTVGTGVDAVEKDLVLSTIRSSPLMMPMANGRPVIANIRSIFNNREESDLLKIYTDVQSKLAEVAVVILNKEDWNNHENENSCNTCDKHACCIRMDSVCDTVE